jgi:hypothetical protein
MRMRGRLLVEVDILGDVEAYTCVSTNRGGSEDQETAIGLDSCDFQCRS